MRFLAILFFVVYGNLAAAQNSDLTASFNPLKSIEDSTIKAVSSRYDTIASMIDNLSAIKDNLANCPKEIRERYDNLMEAWSYFKYVCQSGYYSITAIFRASYYIYTQISYLTHWLYEY